MYLFMLSEEVVFLFFIFSSHFFRWNQIIPSLSGLWRPFLSNCIHMLFITLKIQFLSFEIKKISPGISLFSEIIKMFFISIEAWKALLYPEIVTLTLFADIVVHKDFFNQAFSYPCWIITCFHFLCEAIFASWAYSAVLNLCATFQFVLRLPFYKYGPKYVSYWMRLKH